MSTLFGTRNPFRLQSSTPNDTTTNLPRANDNSPPPFASPSSPQAPGTTASPSSNITTPIASPPVQTVSNSTPSNPPGPNDFDAFPTEEPPPYTPSPATFNGEQSIEYGPVRPFQPPPPQPNTIPGMQSAMPTGLSSPSSPTPSFRLGQGLRGGGLLQRLESSLTNVVNNINTISRELTTQPTGQSNWSTYPGQQSGPSANHNPRPLSYPPPSISIASPPNDNLPPLPPRHPRSPSASGLSPPSSPRPRSEFARDFYAAGDAEVPSLGNPSGSSPASPSTASHQSNRSASSSSRQIPDDGRPTSHPTVGHPLLLNGNVLVYPKGYECEKCHNVGYKNANPHKPCKRCWKKFAKHFSGPLAYSFSPSSSNSTTNFQRPLPAPRTPPPAPPPPPPRPPMQPAMPFNPSPCPFPHGGRLSNRHRGFYSPPSDLPPVTSRPPPGAIIYTAGDHRLGGRLCWQCGGRGNISFLFLDRITCDVCGGIGRTFP